VIPQKPTDGPMGTRMAGLGGHLAVGDHLSRLQCVQHGGHVDLERGQRTGPFVDGQYRLLPDPWASPPNGTNRTTSIFFLNPLTCLVANDCSSILVINGVTVPFSART